MREPEPDTIRRAQSGDTSAFEEIVRFYAGDVYRLARHIVRHDETAEDVTQDTFLNAYRAIGRFRWQAKFSTWLFRIARNAAIESLRRTAREPLPPPEAEHPPSDPALRIALRTAIDALPHDLRESFVVVEIFGFTYTEASTILGVPTGTLKSRMHRTRKILVAGLSEEENAGEV